MDLTVDSPVSSVTIVGGGTAGWLAALMLQGRLNRGRRAPPVRITLVESPTVPIVGVGESSLIGIRNEFENLGIDEAEFARRCNATFKLGVRFVNWNLSEAGAPYTYIHPVSYGVGMLGGKSPLYHYLAFGPHHGCDHYTAADSLDAIIEAIRLRRGPRVTAQPHFKPEFFAYAYHFDAARLAEYLREIGIQRGVTHIFDDVDDAVVTDGDIISHLKLRRNGLMPVELVVDCTGFRGLIVSQILKEPFQGYAPGLLCDRAIPLQIPYREGEAIESATSATALSAGWVWHIPLFTRIGTGYVFSSAFKSDDEAVRELSQHLRIDLDTYQPRVIKMRVGRLRRAWVGNCIAVGLSGGFIEPLEATAIMASMATAFQITRHFPTRSMPETLRREFNRRIDALYDGIRDFITMQYFLANRPEPFWTAARSPTVLSDTLRDNLERWRYRLPDIEDLRPPHLFNELSYSINLASKGFYRDRTLFYQANVSRGDWERHGAHLERIRQRVRGLPTARDFLLQMRGEETWVYGGGGVPLSGPDVPPSFAAVRPDAGPNVQVGGGQRP